MDLAVADDHVGRAGEDRRDELGDVLAVVLVVAVGVDDDVGAELQARVEARLEAGGEALVVRQAHDVVDAAGPRDLDRPVRRAVVDDQPLDRVEAVDAPRQVREHKRKCLLLVEAGDLDDQLHAVGPRGILTSIEVSSVPSATSPAAVASPSPAEAPRRAPSAAARDPHRRAREARPRRARARRPRRLRRLPDVSELRLVLLAAVGPRARRPRPAVLHRLPRADRASAGDRLRRAADAARRRRRPRDGRLRGASRSSCSSPASTRSARPRSRRSSASSPPRCSSRASTSRSSPPAATSTSRTSRSIIWAAVIELRAPRRHPVVVLSLLAAAGLMRPEAWLLAGVYWLWIVPARDVTWRQRFVYAALAAIGPLVWVAVDFAVTGNPLYSLTGTQRPRRGARAQQGRRRGAGRAVRVPRQAREVPGRHRRRGRPRRSPSC